MIQRIATCLLMNIMVIKGKTSLKHLEKSAEDPLKDNLKLLHNILKKNSGTEFGRLHHFSDIRTLEDFRKAVPLSTYDDYKPYIERIIHDEKNVLVKAKVLGYSRTSGSSGSPKYIPATPESLRAYTKYTWTRALALAVERLARDGKKYRPGRGMYTSPSMNTFLPNGLLCSHIAEIGAKKYGTIYPFILTLPTGRPFALDDGDYLYSMFRFALEDENTGFIFSVFYSINISQMAYLKDNWQLIVDDIEKGIVNELVNIKPALREELKKHIRPMPERAAYLRKQFEQGFDDTILLRLWPNLVMLSGIGSASFRGAATQVKKYARGIPMDFSIYGASEGLFAACYQLEDTNMQLLTDSCFMEFLPENEPDGEPLTIDELELGKRYEVIVTTQAGLYRYRMKDIIEVVAFRGKTPLINFVYRRGQLLNLAGEKFTEEDARATIAGLEARYGINITNWIFYADESVSPCCYVLLTECESAVLSDDMIDEIEDIMGQYCKRYPDMRAKRYIGRLKLQTQLPGTHEQWRQKCVDRGAYQFQVKPVHSLDNDAKRDFFLSRISE